MISGYKQHTYLTLTHLQESNLADNSLKYDKTNDMDSF